MVSYEGRFRDYLSALKMPGVEVMVVEKNFMQGSGEAQVNARIYIKL